jgi:hypothetical protein
MHQQFLGFGPQDLWRIPPAQIAFSAGILGREIPSSAGIFSFLYGASTRQLLGVDGSGTSGNQAGLVANSQKNNKKLASFCLSNNYRLIELLGHETSLHDEIAGQILWLDLGARSGPWDAHKGIGPTALEGKQRARCNAVHHPFPLGMRKGPPIHDALER